ncbi:glycoside hydrolase family 3 [Ktedonobacteria bacterium brp13]|nr:glycoside hydrolase family 3 [Ktedonobacteria bacterium brp13]
MVEFVNTDYVSSGLQQMVAQHVGGVLYQPTINGNNNFDASCYTITCAQAFSAQINADETIAPLIAIDEEGGEVDKVSQFFPPSPSAEALAQSGDPKQAYQAYNQAKTDASELKQLGINVDLAPVVDVGPVDPVTYGHRRFSTDATVVTAYASAFLRGLQDNGIPGALKHFPGLGDTDKNPHLEKVVITRSMQDLQNIDLLPYQKIIQNDNPAMVMTTDVLMQAMDPNQLAEISPKVIGYLRNTLHFNGVIITDGLYMDGLYSSLGPDGRPTNDQLIQAGIQTINAGNDLIEGPSNSYEVSGIISGVEAEIQQGTLSQSQIDQSVLRILKMKIKYGIIK